jgi:phenylacetate-CoA ligase
MDELAVRVERRADAGPDDALAAGRALETLVKNTIGVSVTVNVLEPDGVERSMGKMRRIVDERPT